MDSRSNLFQYIILVINKQNKHSRRTKKEPISYHELLTVFDGTGSKDGMIVFINLNDPSKIFKSTNIEDLALFRDRRVNLLLTFEYCNHNMIKELYYNIFTDSIKVLFYRASL